MLGVKEVSIQANFHKTTNKSFETDTNNRGKKLKSITAKFWLSYCLIQVCKGWQQRSAPFPLGFLGLGVQSGIPLLLYSDDYLSSLFTFHKKKKKKAIKTLNTPVVN